MDLRRYDLSRASIVLLCERPGLSGRGVLNTCRVQGHVVVVVITVALFSVSTLEVPLTQTGPASAELADGFSSSSKYK